LGKRVAERLKFTIEGWAELFGGWEGREKGIFDSKERVGSASCTSKSPLKSILPDFTGERKKTLALTHV
jgi:hypothetical protein